MCCAVLYRSKQDNTERLLAAGVAKQSRQDRHAHKSRRGGKGIQSGGNFWSNI